MDVIQRLRNEWENPPMAEDGSVLFAERDVMKMSAAIENVEAEVERLREQVAALREALSTVINAERGITQYHIDLALNALQETA